MSQHSHKRHRSFSPGIPHSSQRFAFSAYDHDHWHHTGSQGTNELGSEATFVPCPDPLFQLPPTASASSSQKVFSQPLLEDRVFHPSKPTKHRYSHSSHAFSQPLPTASQRGHLSKREKSAWQGSSKHQLSDTTLEPPTHLRHYATQEASTRNLFTAPTPLYRYHAEAQSSQPELPTSTTANAPAPWANLPHAKPAEIAASPLPLNAGEKDLRGECAAVLEHIHVTLQSQIDFSKEMVARRERCWDEMRVSVREELKEIHCQLKRVCDIIEAQSLQQDTLGAPRVLPTPPKPTTSEKPSGDLPLHQSSPADAAFNGDCTHDSQDAGGAAPRRPSQNSSPVDATPVKHADPNPTPSPHSDPDILPLFTAPSTSGAEGYPTSRHRSTKSYWSYRSSIHDTQGLEDDILTIC